MNACGRLAVVALLCVAPLWCIASLLCSASLARAEQQPDNSSHPGNLKAPPQDVSVASASVPPKTVAVELCDAEDRPLSGVDVGLWRILTGHDETTRQKAQSARTDTEGKASLGGLEFGRGIAYEVRVDSGSATFTSGQFLLSADRGQLVKLHVYPATTDLDQTDVALRALAYVAPTDEAFQWEVLVTVFNIGRVAWVAHDMRLGLPEDAVGIEPERGAPALDWVAEQRGARIVGTVPPGRHELVLRFRTKSRHTSDATFRFDLPPRVAEVQVIAEGQAETQLEVVGAPPAQVQSGPKGQRLLVVSWQATQASLGLRELLITLSGIPTPGPARWVAVALALGLLAWGVWPGKQQQLLLSSQDARRTREAVLDELVALERARGSERVGPSTYELARAKLLRALAALGTTESPLPGVPGAAPVPAPRWRHRRRRKRPARA